MSSTQSLVVDAAAFAAWSRDRGVALPYPVDLTGVDAGGRRVPDSGAGALEVLAEVCRAPRAAAFALVVDPSGRSDVCVAVAGERSAVRLTVGDPRVTVVQIRESDLVASVVDALPDCAPMRVGPVTIDEIAWNGALEQLALDPAHARGALDSAGLPAVLADAMTVAAQHPVRIGVLGALAWDGASSRIGPSMASWFEYPDGAMIATLLQPRHAFRRTVTLEGYHLDSARRALVEAYGSAQRAADPARRR